MILNKKQTKAYCLACEKEVKYVTKEEIEKCCIKRVNIEYNALKAYCPDCGKDLFVPEYEMINRKNRFDEYKRSNGLLTSDEIIAIRKKYRLSQTKLAKLIRCGEKNIARYELGAVQDRPIDLLIRLVDEHPDYFIK